MMRTIPYILTISAIGVWCILLFVPPVLTSWLSPQHPGARVAYEVFAPICHQQDSHSFHVLHHKLGVCSRCTSIYLGFLAGSLFLPFVASRRLHGNVIALVVAAIPMVIDVGLSFADVTTSTLESRTLTGSLFGVMAALVLLPSWLDALHSVISQSQNKSGIPI